MQPSIHLQNRLEGAHLGSQGGATRQLSQGQARARLANVCEGAELAAGRSEAGGGILHAVADARRADEGLEQCAERAVGGRGGALSGRRSKVFAHECRCTPWRPKK